MVKVYENSKYTTIMNHFLIKVVIHSTMIHMTQRNWFHFFAVFYFFILLFAFYFHPIPLQIANADMGAHLVLGKIIWTTMHIPDTNFLTYTNPDYPFINTTWLSEVIFYGMYSFSGFVGLTLLGVALITTAFFLLYYSLSGKYNPYLFAGVALFYLPILSQRSQVRPELFSYLLLSVLLFILYRYQTRVTNWIYLLIPLFLLWVNLHIYFITGIVTLALFLIALFIKEKKALFQRKHLPLLIASIGSVVAILCNPHLIYGAVYPLFVFNNYGIVVVENHDLLYALIHNYDITLLYFLGSIMGLGSLLCVYFRRLDFFSLFLSLFFILFGLFAVRNSGMFVIATLIPLVRLLTFVVAEKKVKDMSLSLLFFLPVVFLSLPGFHFHFPLHGVGVGVVDKAKDATDFMIKNNLTGTLYNNYDIGSYLEFRLYPKIPVYIDGRPEAYPKSFITNEYYPIESSFENFQKVDAKRHFTIVFYQHFNKTENQHKLLQGLAKSNDWSIVYLDSFSIIFLKNIPAHKAIIDKYSIRQETVTISASDSEKMENLGQLSNLFRVIEWYTPMLKTDIKYLDFDPKNCIALRHVAAIMKMQNHPLTNVYMQRYNTTCLATI